MTDRTKAIDRVRKLRELADPTRGGTENERAVAAQKATQLMERYSLSEVDVAAPVNVLFRIDWSEVFRAASRESQMQRDAQRMREAAAAQARATHLRERPLTAALAAELYGVNAKSFRAWLRRQGIKYDPDHAEEQVRRYDGARRR